MSYAFVHIALIIFAWYTWIAYVDADDNPKDNLKTTIKKVIIWIVFMAVATAYFTWMTS